MMEQRSGFLRTTTYVMVIIGICISLWEGLIDFVEENIKQGQHWFSFKNVKAREFMGKKSLTTIDETVCDVIDLEGNRGVPAAVMTCIAEARRQAEEAQDEVLTDNFEFADYIVFLQCKNPKCLMKLTEIKSEEVQQCNYCNMFQMVESCVEKKKLKVIAKTNKPHLDGQMLVAYKEALDCFKLEPGMTVLQVCGRVLRAKNRKKIIKKLTSLKKIKMTGLRHHTGIEKP